MIFAISGTQGCGKTTVINDLALSPIINKVESQAARTALKQMNCTLMDIYNDNESLKIFQQKVLFNKQQDELSYSQSSKINIIERSYIDLAAYTILNLGRFNDNDVWLTNYVEECLYLQSKYNGTFYLTGNKFPIQNDGVRPINKYYANAIEVLQLDLIQPYPHIMVDVLDRTRRCDLIISKIMESK